MTDFSDRLLATYVGLTRIAEPVARAIVSLRRHNGKEDPTRWCERLGKPSQPRPAGGLVWIHAVSVGESLSAMPLIDHLTRLGLSVLVTTVTTTSAAVVGRRASGAVIHQYAPLDFAGIVDRFLDHWQPDLAICVESEIWPVTIARLKARAIAFVIANGRMSARSARGWGRFGFATAAIFRAVALVLAQTKVDGERFTAIGCPDVQACGNLKFDAAVPEASPQLAGALARAIGDRPVLLGASTHPGEEAILLDAFDEMRGSVAGLLLIIAPRHPERGDSLAATLSARWTTARRSTGDLPTAATDVYLADTLGEMGTLYRISRLTCIGGTLVKGIGGHNPIEPARLGAAILSGPFHSNWPDVYDSFSQKGGLIEVSDARSLAAAAARLFSDEHVRQAQITAAMTVVQSHSGALNRIALALAPLLPHPANGSH